MNFEIYTDEEYDLNMHTDLCTSVEHLYWSYEMGDMTLDEAQENLLCVHLEFIDDLQEASLSTIESWNAYVDFMRDLNR